MLSRSFRWAQKDKIAGSAKPFEEADIDWLCEQGIKAVVSLERFPPDLLPELEQKGIKHLFLPVPDGGVPTPEQAEMFLAFTEEQTERKNRPVLVHCAAGLGRTGLMLALYLVNKGMAAEQAIDEIGTLENAGQREFVLQFASKIEKH